MFIVYNIRHNEENALRDKQHKELISAIKGACKDDSLREGS